MVKPQILELISDNHGLNQPQSARTMTLNDEDIGLGTILEVPETEREQQKKTISDLLSSTPRDQNRKEQVKNDILAQTTSLKHRLAERQKIRTAKKQRHNQEYAVDNGIKMLNLEGMDSSFDQSNVSFNLDSIQQREFTTELEQRLRRINHEDDLSSESDGFDHI